MTKVKIIFFSIIGLLMPIALTANNRIAVRDSLLHELSLTKTPQDSIPLLYHLYDTSRQKADRLHPLAQLIETAQRANNLSVKLDALRGYTNIVTATDSLMGLYLNVARALPPGNERDEAIAFIEINRISTKARTQSEAQKMKTLQKLISNYRQGQARNIYDEIKQLYEVCLYLSHSTTGELYTEYLEKLHELINELPEDGRKVLPNMYYTQLAIIYTKNKQYEKAIAADKELLKIIQKLEIEYKRQGRIFKNYDTNYYICYRRILSNYPALTPDEVEYYYQQIIELTRINKEIQIDFEESKRPLIYYLMAKKEYARVLPVLKTALNAHANRFVHMEILRFMTEAATEVNDKAVLLQATTRYNALLEEYNKTKSAEKYKELQILYDVNQLKADNAQLELEKREAEIESSRVIIRLTIIAISILSVLLVIVFWLYNRTKRLAGHLQRSKQILQDERVVLLDTQKELTIARDQAESANRMKTLFIQNMSHEIRTPLNAIMGFSQLIAENAEGKEKEEMDMYAQMINGNSELLLTLVGDVLDIAKMESGEIKLNMQPCSIQAICQLAISNVKHRAQPGVKMYFQPDKDAPIDMTLLTDATRLEQVLINFLTNASKFTSEGEIILSYTVDNDRRQVIFSVTDTGPGIPADKVDIIFERFEKLDSFAQGTGLGLHICRLIANMLKGKVMVDTSYTDGARFLFIHPIN